MNSKAISELKKQIFQRSYREGEFTLSSGQKSNFYIDLKTTTLHPDGAYWMGEAACDFLFPKNLPISGVGGLTLGADPIATALSLAARNRGKTWPAFIVRKEVKAHGTSRCVEGIENLSQGGSVLVLEDVVTTGSSSIQAIHKLRHAGLKPIAVFTIVDRESQGKEAIQAEGVEFFSLIRLSELQKESLHGKK